MQALDAAYPELESLKTVPMGISVDSAQSKAVWARELRLKKLHLLADFWPHGKISKKLGVFDKKAGVSLRANIIISKKGKVLLSKVYPMNQLPDLKAILKFLKERIAREGAEKNQKSKPVAVKNKPAKPKAAKTAPKPLLRPRAKPAEMPAVKPESAEEPKALPAENSPDKASEKTPEA
jgi:alkyl hydroperoxide reductase subunit AhpC